MTEKLNTYRYCMFHSW